MNAMFVYKQYDQAALDDQYNNRAKVHDFDAVVRDWGNRSAAFRNRTTGFLDVAYGPGERETFDVFPVATFGAPLHVFFHGGYWQAMDKSFFHFTGEELHRRGAHVAFVNYPLAPKGTLDAIVSACRRSVAWLCKRSHELIGDNAGIYVSGHSAGGHLLGMLMATDWEKIGSGGVCPALLGGCSLSGLFNLEPIRLCTLNSVLQFDQATVRRNSPLFLEPSCRFPMLLVTGGLESDEYQSQSLALEHEWGRLGVAVSHQSVSGADHFSILETLVDPGSPILQTVLRMMGLPTPR
jgi:arylformamidase